MKAPVSFLFKLVGGREGAILGVVLVVLVILSFVSVGLLTLTSATGMEAGRSIGSVQAFWTAEAGLEQVKAIANKRRRPLNKIVQAGSPSGFLYGSNALVGTTSKGSYAVDVLDDPAWTNAVKALKKYIIVSRATANNGARQRVSIHTMIQSFASYMHASNWEQTSGNANIYFGTGDIIDGPVYVNDQLNILGSPRFLQLVSSAQSSVNYSPSPNPSVFEGGLALNAVPLDIAGQFTSDHIVDLKDEALSGGLAVTGDYKFKFNSDGSFTYVQITAGAPTNTGYLSALNGAIYVDGDAWVEGVVDGNVTLAAQDSIYISNNITYASAQSPTPWQTNTFNVNAVDDTLGLMASNQFQIVGTNVMTIHAAVMVTSDGGGFNTQKNAADIGAPYINLYGSLIQYRRGVVGHATTPFQGYRKNYKYDTRFDADAPPNFPYSIYVFSRWDQDGY
jgi:hypothetical protein